MRDGLIPSLFYNKSECIFIYIVELYPFHSPNEAYPNKTTSVNSINALASEVISVNWGNGQDRRK